MSMESYIQWCNENEGRAYPLADAATQLDISGNKLPTDILADMCIMAPSEYADAYVSSVRITSNLIAVSVASGQAPLLHCVVYRSTYVPYTSVALTPLVPDVSGWAVFGNHMALVNEYYRFSGAAQSGLAPRALRVVERIPVQSFSLLNRDPQKWIDRLVRVLGGTALRIYKSETASDTIIIELDKARAEAFLGPCNVYDSSTACPAPPICSINGVTANDAGDLVLRFQGAG